MACAIAAWASASLITPPFTHGPRWAWPRRQNTRPPGTATLSIDTSIVPRHNDRSRDYAPQVVTWSSPAAADPALGAYFHTPFLGSFARHTGCMAWKEPRGWRKLREATFARWGRQCWRCGGYATTVDHVTPVCLGGGHELGNLRPACRRCNYGTRASIGNRLRGYRPADSPVRHSRRW